MSPRDIMVVQRSFRAYTPIESIYHNIFVIILFLYHLGSNKFFLTLVSIHLCVSFGNFKIRTLLSQGDKTGIFNTVQTRLQSKENINWINLVFFYYSKRFCSAKSTSNFVVNIKLLLLFRGFQTFHIFIFNNFEDCTNLVLWLGNLFKAS